MLRIDPALHAALRGAADAAGTSLNDYCARKLTAPTTNLGDPSAATAVGRAADVIGGDLVAVAVFGSWARDAMTEASDVDLLIVVDDSVPITRDLYRAWDAAPIDWQGRTVEPHFVHLIGKGRRVTGLWAEVAVDGVLLFDRGFGLSRRLAALRRAIRRGATRAPRDPRSTLLAGGRLMRNVDLATDYVRRATIRLRAVQVLFDADSWADVVRESQEIVELALKGLLRSCGIDPPRVRDVSDVLLAERGRLPDALEPETELLVEISRTLRRDRELAFYGAEDLTPSGFYSRADAERALRDARRTVELVRPHVLAD